MQLSTRPVTPQRLYRAIIRATWPATLLSMSVSAAASARGVEGKYPPKVQAVLDYLKQHPMTVTSQAMQYDADPTTELPACIHGLQPADVVSDSAYASSHMAQVITALLYAACGGLDHAHNLVTPLCWGSWTPYAGKPVSNSPAAAEAAYVHAIVHRQEGRCIGEFGSGFSNANYWYRAAGNHPVAEQIFKDAGSLAAGDLQLEAHLSGHGSSWQPSKFVGLCDKVASSGSAELLPFCEGVMAAELRLLLQWCYGRL